MSLPSIEQTTKYKISLVVWVVLVILALGTAIFLAIEYLPTPPHVGFNGVTLEFPTEPWPPVQKALLDKSILAVTVILLNWLFLKIGTRGKSWLEQKFFRIDQDYRNVADALTEAMSNAITMPDLSEAIIGRLMRAMHLRQIGIVFFQKESFAFTALANPVEPEMWESFIKKHDIKLFNVLRKFSSENWFTVDYLPDELRPGFASQTFISVLPLRTRGRLAGALLIGRKQSDLSLSANDMRFLSSIAKQLGASLEKAYLYEELAQQERFKHELEIARHIQLASLPQYTPKLDGLDIAGISIPSLEVGGDYFDYLNGVLDHFTVIIGDVSGKGTSAALYMSKVQGIVRSIHGFGLSPRELLLRTNQLLWGDIEKKSFVTAISANFSLTERGLLFARAGHLPLFHYRNRINTVEKLSPKGLGLGLTEQSVFDAELDEVRISYESGDIFLFVTDGVTEARSPNEEEFGEDKLEALLLSSVGKKAASIRDRIIDEVNKFTQTAHQHDDQTVVVVCAK